MLRLLTRLFFGLIISITVALLVGLLVRVVQAGGLNGWGPPLPGITLVSFILAIECFFLVRVEMEW